MDMYITRTETHPPLTTGTASVRHRPAIRIRWDSVLTALVALVVGLTLGVTVATAILAKPQPLPPCTDAIADARGMCQGPLID